MFYTGCTLVDDDHNGAFFCGILRKPGQVSVVVGMAGLSLGYQ
jgi:hypothetical protein